MLLLPQICQTTIEKIVIEILNVVLHLAFAINLLEAIIKNPELYLDPEINFELFKSCKQIQSEIKSLTEKL